MTAQSNAKIQGSCACTKITYEAKSPPRRVHWCNCSTCRKLSGGPFMAFAGFRLTEVKICAGGLVVDSTRVTNQEQNHFSTFEITHLAVRGACKDCHSPLTMFYYHQPDVLWMTVGSMDEHTMEEADLRTLQPASHIFCKDKAGWYDVHKDGIPMWPGFPEGE